MIDGDTIDVELDAGEAVRVRLLGVDTPETHKPGTPVECGGFEATANMLRLSFTRPRDDDGDGLVDTEGGSGRTVTLRTDPSQATFDAFGRLLAYVTTRGGVNLSAQQLAARSGPSPRRRTTTTTESKQQASMR